MDVDVVRKSFPALASGLARFDGPGGSLVPRQVADAMAAAMSVGMCQRGPVAEPDRLTEATTVGAREAMGRLLGADPRGIVFGRSMTALTFDIARTLSSEWGPGDEVVVTRLDHDANIRPWVRAAERSGATVRWLGFDAATAELDDVRPLLNGRTRLVAVTAASNLLGTRPDVPAVVEAAHAVDALVYVDGVHLVPHAPVDLGALGADFLACSPYKFFGPHLGVLAAAPMLLESLNPDKVLPSSDAVPERFELGTLPYEQLAGVSTAVEFIEALHGGAGMASVETHEAELLAYLLDGLADLSGVTVHGRPARRTPTVLLRVAGLAPAEVSTGLAGEGVIAPAGSFYAIEASRHAGLGEAGGVRVGSRPTRAWGTSTACCRDWVGSAGLPNPDRLGYRCRDRFGGIVRPVAHHSPAAFREHLRRLFRSNWPRRPSPDLPGASVGGVMLGSATTRGAACREETPWTQPPTLARSRTTTRTGS